MKVIYPIIITEDPTDKVPFFVEIPSLNGATQGETFEDAITMARDYIGLAIVDRIDNNESIPNSEHSIPSVTSGVATLVDVDISEYRRKHDNSPTKKTLTIPRYLNELGKEKDLNFSEILTKGLKKELKVH